MRQINNITLIAREPVFHEAFAELATMHLEGVNVQFRNTPMATWEDDWKSKLHVLVAPGNSYGIMSGGLDLAIETALPGTEQHVRSLIQEHYLGEMNVGQALVSMLGDSQPAVIYAPTMRVPRRLPEDTEAPYLATWAALRCYHILRQQIAIPRSIPAEAVSLALPAMGVGSGGVNPAVAARQMVLALKRYQAETLYKTQDLFGVATHWDWLIKSLPAPIQKVVS